MGRRLYKIISLLVSLIIFSVDVYAAVRVSATIDESQVTLDQETNITVTVEGTREAGDLVVPSVDGLEIVQTGRVPVIHIINGQERLGTEFYLRVIPRKPGRFTIPGFQIQAAGSTYQTKPLALTVTETPYATNRFGTQTQGPAQVSPPFWIEAEVSNPNPYYGEQILYRLKLYTRLNIRQARPRLPEFRDFITETITPDQKETKTINGTNYLVLTKAIALFPVKEGPVTIGKTEVDVAYDVAAQPSQGHRQLSPFFSFTFKFGFQQTKEETLTAGPIPIQVKPLPRPVPEDFTHLVGEFGVQTRLSDTAVEEGESVTFEVHLSGKGNIRDGALPDLDFPGFKIYEDKPTVETHQSPDGISGKKIFKMALVAVEPGNLTLPAFQLSYFDPGLADYVHLDIKERTVSVAPGEDKPTQTVLAQTNAKNAGQRVLLKDIAPVIAEGEQVLAASPFKMNRVVFAIMFWSLPSLFLGLVVLRSARSRLKRPNKKTLKKSAYRELRHRLSHRYLDQGEVLEAVRTYLAKVLDVPGASLTALDMERLCLERGIEAPLASRLRQGIENLEAVRYGFDKEAAIGDIVKELKDVLAGVHRGIGG